VLAVILLIVAGVSIGTALLMSAQRSRSAASAAIETRGEIVSLQATRGDRPRWVATYTYVAGGRTYSGTGRLGRRDRQALSVGDSIDVRYLPTEPGKAWVGDYQPNQLPIALAPLAFAFMIIPAVVFLVAVRRQSSLLSEGRPAVAVVTGARRVSTGHSHHESVAVEFRALSGALVTAHLNLQKRPKIGSDMVVVYDAETPTRCARYPFSLVRPDVPMT
jgi:hypothetical protein